MPEGNQTVAFEEFWRKNEICMKIMYILIFFVTASLKKALDATLVQKYFNLSNQSPNASFVLKDIDLEKDCKLSAEDKKSFFAKVAADFNINNPELFNSVTCIGGMCDAIYTKEKREEVRAA